MDEVRGPFVHDDWDYLNLKGDTGPLVYPAGFVYIFEALRRATDDGKAIFRAQLIFSLLHALLLCVVLLGIYPHLDGLFLGLAPLTVLSRRVHSIFSLRLFNDGVAMLLAYAFVHQAARSRFTRASLLLTAAVSVKMNCILFAPGYAVVLLYFGGGGLPYVLRHATLCGLVQVALALPFLRANATGYISRSFDLGRVFFYEWTVNFKFLSPERFQSKELSLALLAATLVSWLLFGHFRWAREGGGLFRLLRLPFGFAAAPSSSSKARRTRKMNPEFVVTCLFESNFVGIAFSRSMHYQFYAWYAHSLPYLLSKSGSVPVGLAVWAAVELAFNVFPATPLSSLTLQLAHAVLLLVLAFRKDPALGRVFSSDEEEPQENEPAAINVETKKKLN